MPARVKITGGAQTARALQMLGRNSSQAKVLRQALRPGARQIVKVARRLVPVATGELKRSITIGTLRTRQAAGRLVVGHRGARARISHLVEFGTRFVPARPYMRPAARQAGGEAFIRRFGQEIWPKIAREAQRVAVRSAIRRSRR